VCHTLVETKLTRDLSHCTKTMVPRPLALWENCMYAIMHVRMYVSVHVCMCVRMYECMYVCMFVCVYVCMHACMYVRTYVCMYVCMHVCMHVCMYACLLVCLFVCLFVRNYVCMCVCVCMCIWVSRRDVRQLLGIHAQFVIFQPAFMTCNTLSLTLNLSWLRRGTASTKSSAANHPNTRTKWAHAYHPQTEQQQKAQPKLRNENEQNPPGRASTQTTTIYNCYCARRKQNTQNATNK